MLAELRKRIPALTENPTHLAPSTTTTNERHDILHSPEKPTPSWHESSSERPVAKDSSWVEPPDHRAQIDQLPRQLPHFTDRHGNIAGKINRCEVQLDDSEAFGSDAR
jgi:hypothetical protein